MNLNYRFISLLIVLLCSFSNVSAQIKFRGTEFPGDAFEFTGDPNGETSISVQASGNLPSKRYDFELIVNDSLQLDLVDFSDTFLHFDNKRSNQATATLTDTGLTQLEELGTLNIPFTVKYSGKNDPGFAQLPGTLIYSSADIEEVLDEDVSIELKPLTCPVLVEVFPGIYSLSTETETIEPETTLTFDENFLDSFNFLRAPQIIEFDSSNLRFLTAEEIVASLEKQVANVSVRVALQPSVRRALDLINDTGKKYNLSPTTIENVETLSNGKIQADVKMNLYSSKRTDSELLQVSGFRKQILRRFVNNKTAVKTLLSGENIEESDLRDPNFSLDQNISFKFLNNKGSFFSSQRKTLKFLVKYTITRLEEESGDSDE
ncbi:MAG: hypothetical protein HRT47_00930 [Candidatus Caenarcaniphilales bacterium]|nr:hypothetical protein [Candidatus Caenarcaniphilales bacterium]